MKTDSNFYKKGKERDEVIKECVDMIRFYRTAPLSNRNGMKFQNRARYYMELKNKLRADIRLEKMWKRAKI